MRAGFQPRTSRQRVGTVQASRATGQAGESLIEVLVTVSVVSIVVLGMLMTMWVLVRSTDAGRRSGRATTEAISQAESFLNVGYVSCAVAADYNTTAFKAANPLPANYVATLKVRYLVNATPSPAPGETVASATFSSSCPSPDQGVQELTVTVSNTAGGQQVSRSITVLKRNTTCASTTFAGYTSGQRC